MLECSVENILLWDVNVTDIFFAGLLRGVDISMTVLKARNAELGCVCGRNVITLTSQVKPLGHRQGNSSKKIAQDRVAEIGPERRSVRSKVPHP